MSYLIFSDVSLDIDRDFAKANDVKFIPMEYVLGEEVYNCAEPESDEMMHDYYEKLRNKIETKTSQITPGHYCDQFEAYAKEGTPLLYISLSSGLSNTYDSAQLAVTMLKDKYENAQIEIVDSLGATGGQGLLVEAAVKNREKGMSLEENAAWLRENAKKVNYWFMVEDLMYLKRGGRVSAAAAVMGTALSIKPILRINGKGKLDTVDKKRGVKLALKSMADRFAANFDPSISGTVYICTADARESGEALKELILQRYAQLDVKITMLSPIIGAHTGPDMVSLIYFGTDR